MNESEKTRDIRFDIIDQELNLLFDKMEYEDYIDFIKNDRYIACYDHMLAYIDLHVYPAYLKRMIKDELLDIIEKKLTNKLKELNY